MTKIEEIKVWIPVTPGGLMCLKLLDESRARALRNAAHAECANLFRPSNNHLREVWRRMEKDGWFLEKAVLRIMRVREN